MKILRANIKDINLIAPLFDQYRQFYKQPSNIQNAIEFLSDRIKNNESVIFYACDEVNILGFIQLYPSYSSISLKKLWILNDLFVSSGFRRLSIGKSLIQSAIEFSLESKARGLTLKTANDNIPAQKLYETLGWKRDLLFYSYNFTNK